MHIIIDCSTISRGGGVAVHIINMLNNFSDKNEIIAFVKNKSDSTLFNIKKNVSFKDMPFYNIFTRIIYEQVIIPLYALQKRVDVIYLPKQYAPLLRTTKIVTTIHDFIPDKKFGGESIFARVYWKIQYNLIKMKSDCIIFYTNMAVKEYKKRFRNLSKKKYGVVLNGFDSYEKKEHQREKYILIPSTIKKRKNTEMAINLALKIQKEFPDKKIVIIGRTDSHIIERRIKEKNGAVEFLGFVEKEKAEELFNDAFVVLYLSTDEGFGLPIAEAIYLDKMVIASDTKINKYLYKNMPIYYNLTDSIEANSIRIIEKLNKGTNYEEKKRTWKQAGSETESLIESIL